MKQYILVSEKPWHDRLMKNLESSGIGVWHRITSKDSFSGEAVSSIQPEWIFIPHWSHMIPAAVYEKFNCVLFHMTDLPFGRGGSPLQNLIVRGFSDTKLTAIRVSKGIDTGDIYLQENLSLRGTAEEIFIRAAELMEKMIREIIATSPIPRPQTGDVVEFKRRLPQDGNIADLSSVEKVYDYIRMLDADGYPPAYIELGNWKLEFKHASLENDGSLKADVRIIKK